MQSITKELLELNLRSFSTSFYLSYVHLHFIYVSASECWYKKLVATCFCIQNKSKLTFSHYILELNNSSFFWSVSNISFSPPTGIAILFRKPMKEPPKLFSFMSPFSGTVWMWLGIAYMSVSLTLFILGRISPTEWDNPYPCIEEPTELENQFSFPNCLWFSIGALLQQGSELAPKWVHV